MAPLSLKVVLAEGAVSKTVLFESGMRVAQAQAIVKEKVLTADDGKEYGLFLTSADDEGSGVWLEGDRNLEYYMLRDGDQLHYLCRIRNLRIRMLDGSVKTLQVDESKTVAELMVGICARIGITNHDEYGLCREDEEAEEKPAAGAGTLTRRAAPARERDHKLDQLSKKLKTDDNVEWLEQHRTLREQRVPARAPLLLRRRLFYTDRNVDARDPVGLTLLYVQTRNDILEGRHPVTEPQALEFAGLQCQVQYGDFHEEKHKPSMIDPSEFLPKGRSARGMESKILKEHRKHQGLSELDAKHLYTKTARELPTYGVTFFLVKEQQKGKKKLVPRLLGINAESILRLSEETKEVLQVWPLTQVKTYHAGKSESFTLNFGDYSDKEYSVKTNDAHRIRDILQGYIDIIKRRMDAQHRLDMTEHYAIMEDHVEASRGLTMEHVSQNASKLVEETFVGPSKIISYEPGQQISQGTQIVTVQQMVITAKGSNQQSVVSGEVPMRKDMSMDCVRKLNRLNSNSVKIVTFLSEPSDSNVAEVRKLVETMQSDMPTIEEGINAAAQKQGSEDAKKKLLDELRELRDCMKALTDATATNVNPENGQEAAKSIADLSTQMYFTLDPRTIKRGEFCRDYQGPILDASDVEELEKAAEDKMGKLNAAVALFLTAYADPKNIDYSAAVNSMNTINELVPQLTKDAQMLSGVKDGKSRQELLDQMRALCDAAKMICLITKPEDHDKMQEAAEEYGRASQKLLFTFKRMRNNGGENDKHNQLIELAKDVGDKTSLLVAEADELSQESGDPRAEDARAAAGACARAARDLLACAKLTAPSIHEPHCRSALLAAAETLSSRAQQLAASCKPLGDGERLRDPALDLAKALDRLKAAFAGLDGSPESDVDSVQAKEGRRLKFITTVGKARKDVDDAEAELNKPMSGAAVTGASAEDLKRSLAQRIAQLNAALTALVAATADRDNPDYATADLAVATITKLMPGIVKDGKALSAGQDEKARAEMLADLKALCDATRDICTSSEQGSTEDLNSSAAKFANTSGKLFFVFNPRASQNKEHEIVDLSSSACEKTSHLLGAVQRLVAASGSSGAALDAAGARVADAANALLTAAQLTAPSIEDPRCQASLLSAADGLSHAGQELAAAWAPVAEDKRAAELEELRRAVEDELGRLRKACQVAPSGIEDADDEKSKERRRLKFIASVSNAQKTMSDADAELNERYNGPIVKGATEDELKKKMMDRIAQLNAALSALLEAASDADKPDYARADQAVGTITELMPQIVKDGKTLSGAQDGEELLGDLRALCAAARDACAASHHGDVESLNRSASNFGNTSGKLVYVFNPRADQDKEHEIIDLSSSACQRASELLGAARALHAPALHRAGDALARRANALLAATQLTASCIQDPRCQASLLSAADGLSHAGQELAAAWAPVAEDKRAAELEALRRNMQEDLDRLKKACQVAPSGIQVKHMDPVQERQRLQFVNTAAAAVTNLQKAHKELDKPAVPSRSDQTPASLQNKLAQSLAQLNAALASLLSAMSDRDNPNYDEAEQAIHIINHLMPQVIKETKSLSASKPEPERKALLDELRALCDATHGICTSLQHGDTHGAAQLAAKATKLTFLVSPQQRQQQKIVDLCEAACEEARRLAANQRERPADAARILHAADALLATTQLAAPHLHSRDAAAALHHAADALQHASAALPPPATKPLHHALDRLRAAVQEDATVKSPSRRSAPPPPPRSVSHGAAALSQEFLHRLRCEETNAMDDSAAAASVEAKLKRKTDDEKALEQEFAKTVDAAAHKIKKAEEDAKKLYTTNDEVIPALSVDQTIVVQKQMEQKLALAGVAVADLVACNHPDYIDYPTASKSTTTLTDLMPHIVQDAKLLRGSLDENERKAFLADIMGLFDATKLLLNSATNDRKMLDKSAVEFGNKSAKLLYVVSTDVDPGQEKEVLERVRVVNESAMRLTLQGAAGAGAGGMAAGRAGAATAQAATALAYTAKLVAPSIQNSSSNEALSRASNNLTSSLQTYVSTWDALETAADSPVPQMRSEAATLEALLEDFKRDLSAGKLVKRRAVERVVVEDTPLRQLACIVLEGAKRKAESTNTPADMRVKYAKYANELSRAIRDLDLANHRCRQAPHDTVKRQNLEFAVQNLQVSLLQDRPALDGKPQNNIVDLTDYVKDIAADAEALKKVCKDNKELQTIRDHCETISAQASSVMSPGEQLDKMADGPFDDIQEVEYFAEKCDKHVNAINQVTENMPDGKLKIDLQEKATRLSEDCNLLRFATKCALATGQSVSLDATLEDLTELESMIGLMLAPGDKQNATGKQVSVGAAGARLCAGAARAGAGAGAGVAPACAAYAARLRAHTHAGDPKENHRTEAHLRKVLSLLKALTMTTSRHVVTWQKLGHPDAAQITSQIIEELESYENSLQSSQQSGLLSDVDMKKLLFPTAIRVQGDEKQVSEQLQAAAGRLAAAGGALQQATSASRAQDAARAAAELAGRALARAHTDLAHSQKIEEAAKEMSVQTYMMLKSAEVVSQAPQNYAARRRLMDACRLLNDAINQLVRVSGPGGRAPRGELSRQLRLAPGAPLAASPASYQHCADQLLSQADVLQKLNNTEPMSREEFSRTLAFAATAVCNSGEYAAHCAYLLSIADQNKEVALEGLANTSRIVTLADAVQDTCHRIIRTDLEQVSAEGAVLDQQMQELEQALGEAGAGAEPLEPGVERVREAATGLRAVLAEKGKDKAKLVSSALRLVDASLWLGGAAEDASRAPPPQRVGPDAQARCDEIMNHSRNLNDTMVSLVREVEAEERSGRMTWVTFGARTKAVLDAFDALLNSVKENGKRAGVLEQSHSDTEEEDMQKKSYIQIQLDLVNKWLRRPASKADVKAAGDDAAKNIIDLGEKIAEDLKGAEQEELLHLIAECKALQHDCIKKYDQEKASALLERLKELKKSIERGVVTRVVEDFLEGEAPLADLDLLADAEKDESKRKFILEQKIASLLLQLARVGRTARVVAGAGGARLAEDLQRCSQQTELLAPQLVKAAQQRVVSPEDQAAIEHYQKLLAEYAESLAHLRGLCDQAVDPMDFVQTAGETMQRMREESSHNNDPQKCAYASTAITKLANRVITVGLSSVDVRRDPELQKALREAQERLRAAVPAPNARQSRIPDWKDTTAEILRTTGEVESVLGGEMIFKKQQGADQPIFAAAFGLHTAVREWSARDNEIVAVAKRMAVLMAKLSDYMNTDRKRELLATTKAIVSESHEVANLARKLAHECTDVRIKTNLLQVCERIPTISGQLKMLATVKGSTLGHQELKEDQEAMMMLVGNAQNLMSSVQEVVKAAASASVKIASQRAAPRMRWVRRNYY